MPRRPPLHLPTRARSAPTAMWVTAAPSDTGIARRRISSAFPAWAFTARTRPRCRRVMLARDAPAPSRRVPPHRPPERRAPRHPTPWHRRQGRCSAGALEQEQNPLQVHAIHLQRYGQLWPVQSCLAQAPDPTSHVRHLYEPRRWQARRPKQRKRCGAMKPRIAARVQHDKKSALPRARCFSNIRFSCAMLSASH